MKPNTPKVKRHPRSQGSAATSCKSFDTEQEEKLIEDEKNIIEEASREQLTRDSKINIIDN